MAKEFLKLSSIMRWLWPLTRRWQKRVLFEDALKFLHEQEETGRTSTGSDLAKAVGISEKSLPRFVESLQNAGLLAPTRTGEETLQLTTEGRQEARRIVRLHRLWEQYLAEQTGLGPHEWHETAHRLEHTTPPEVAETLAARLGFPRFDPHGDPIPTESGELVKRPGMPLSQATPGDVVQVCHIEDEPAAAYQELLDNHLHLGTPIRVESVHEDGVTVRHHGQSIRLSSEASANLWVREPQVAETRVWEKPRTTLADLSLGEEAVVTGISPQCRGLQRRRLLDLGFVPGTVVKAELRSPSGDPTAFRVRNTLIALRKDQAQAIYVESPAGRAVA